MKNSKFLMLIFTILILSCKKESIKLKNIDNVLMKVNFSETKSKIDDTTVATYEYVTKAEDGMTKQTPDNYFVALKSATLVGYGGDADFELFNEASLSNAFVFDFADENTTQFLLEGIEIPTGEYSGILVEIYYLQMKLNITTSSAVEQRNIRIYLSDDAEVEGGLHQPGDMTQIDNNNVEQGWLLGNGQLPDFTPVTPRIAAYSTPNGVWFDFAGKNASDFGPFGDLDFANSAPHPIYSTTIPFDYNDKKGDNAVLIFDVYECWQFEDKNLDGNFGAADLDSLNPTRWNMAMPVMTLTME